MTTPHAIRRRRLTVHSTLSAVAIALYGCGGDSGTDVPAQLESLAVHPVTVQAAVDFILKSPMIVPTTCGGDPSINCPGGVAGAQLSLPLTHTAPTVAELSNRVYSFATDVAMNNATAIPFTYAGVSCNVTINTSQGASPTVHVSGTATFAQNPITNKTYLNIEPTVTGLEDADVALTGDFLCTTTAASLKPAIIATVLTAIENQGGQLCGAPGPTLFIDCASTTLSQKRTRRGVLLALMDRSNFEQL